MRNLKLSFAFVIAILAVGVTIATKANFFGSRVITGCFTDVRLTNGTISPIDPVSYAQQNNLNCAQMQTALLGSGTSSIKFLTSAPSLVVDDACQPQLDEYCCVTFELAPASSPAVPVDLGEGAQKYQVKEVRCRFE